MRGEQPETTAAPAPPGPGSSLPIVEFQLLWYERLDWRTNEAAREVKDFYDANGWVRVEPKSLPKVLGDLGSQGWEIAHWDWEDERVLLRRSKSRSEAGYRAVEYYALALAGHEEGELGATFLDPKEEYEAEGWNFLDHTPGGLSGRLNALGSKGWDLAAWTLDFAIFWRPRSR